MSPAHTTGSRAHALRDRSAGAPRTFWPLAPILVFLVAIAVTQPPFIGDGLYYCDDVVGVLQHSAPAASLWEAGHILWRPLAYVFSPLFLALIPDRVAWTPSLKIGYGLMLFSLASGLFAAILIYDLSRRLMMSARAAFIPLLLFVWGDGVLAYTQAATAYLPGFAILTMGIWWQICGRRTSRGSLVGPALLYGIAGLFWLPYVLAIPAACACDLVQLPGEPPQRLSWGRFFLSGFIAGGLVLGGVGLAAALADVHSVAQGSTWLIAAGHGMHQTRQAVRAITGASRLFLDLGADGVYFKRFLFHDPYHPVTAAALIVHNILRPAFFYCFLGASVFLAWRNRNGQRLLILLGLAGLPTLAAAILIFEPSSPERFFPVLPFLLLTVGAGWISRGRGSQPAKIMICLFALLLPAMNAPTFFEAFSGQHRKAAKQVMEFRAKASPNDNLVALMLSEPIVELPTQRPFDPLNRPSPVNSIWALRLMENDAEKWPAVVARYVLESWDRGKAAWVEKAALADTPVDRLLWVEGDNPQVHWRDVPPFFRSLEFDSDSGSPDGFLRVAHTEKNIANLRQVAGL